MAYHLSINKYSNIHKRHPPFAQKDPLCTLWQFLRSYYRSGLKPIHKLLCEMNLANAEQTILQHGFFKDLSSLIPTWNSDHVDKFGYPLFVDGVQPVLQRKSFESVVSKIYRQCYLQNTLFPSPPVSGWIDDTNYLKAFNDLIRTKLTCKFIDGPELVANLLTDLARAHNLSSTFYSRSLDDGYYAFHFYVDFQVNAYSAGSSMPITLRMEIQISTQLKDVMYEILHKYYEKDRMQQAAANQNWKWDVKSNKFRSGYLAHTLHLLESIIIELR